MRVGKFCLEEEKTLCLYLENRQRWITKVPGVLLIGELHENVCAEKEAFWQYWGKKDEELRI